MDLNKLYNDAFEVLKKERILYRGFLLEKDNEGILSIKDIRNPYYKEPTKKDLKILFEKGFVTGATYLLMKSDKRKIEKYKKLIDQQIKLSLKIGTNPRKLEEYKNSIIRYDKEISYYESQINRWENFINHNSI